MFKKSYLICIVLLALFAITFSFTYKSGLIFNAHAALTSIGIELESSPSPTPVPQPLPNINEQIHAKEVDTLSVEVEYLLQDTVLDEGGKKIVLHPENLLVLINKDRNLPENWAPEDLIVPNVPFYFPEHSEIRYLRRPAALALEELFAKAKEDNINILANSGFRSYRTQQHLFNSRAKIYGAEVTNLTTAYPGQSEHQTGLAMDISSSVTNHRLTAAFGDTKEGKWLAENVVDFGFIIRYPRGKEDITGYSYEPWHIRYVGKDIALYMDIMNLTLEEFYEFKTMH
jgi:zinc D-Ala-D-Ala carboxypeptidase